MKERESDRERVYEKRKGDREREYEIKRKG